jgi:hypothetical protein
MNIKKCVAKMKYMIQHTETNKYAVGLDEEAESVLYHPNPGYAYVADYETIKGIFDITSMYDPIEIVEAPENAGSLRGKINDTKKQH